VAAVAGEIGKRSLPSPAQLLCLVMALSHQRSQAELVRVVFHGECWTRLGETESGERAWCPRDGKNGG
jgi:hypothetical protein